MTDETYPGAYDESYTEELPGYSVAEGLERNVLLDQLAAVVNDPSEFDRKRFEKDPTHALLDTWATMPASDRADAYAGWKMVLDQMGVDELKDFEILLMSYQERDSKAYDAVKAGESVVNQDWYEKYVLYQGNQKSGPTYGSVTGDETGRDVFGTRQAWTDDANLTLDQAKRVKDLVYQGLGTYEPTPLQSGQDKWLIAGGRGAMAVGAIMATYALLAGATGTAGITAIGTGLRMTGAGALAFWRGGQSMYADGAATIQRYLEPLFWETELAQTNPRQMQRVAEWMVGMQMRVGEPVTEVMVKVAGKTPLIGETAASMTQWGMSGWRSKLFVRSVGTVLLTDIYSYFNADNIERDQDARTAEQEDVPQIDEDASTSRSSRGAKLQEIMQRKAAEGDVDESSAGRTGRSGGGRDKRKADAAFTAQPGRRYQPDVERVDRFQDHVNRVSDDMLVRASNTAQLAYIAGRQQMAKTSHSFRAGSTTTTTAPSTSGKSGRGSRGGRDNSQLGTGTVDSAPSTSGETDTGTELAPPPPPDPLFDMPEVTMDTLRQVQLGVLTPQEALGVSTLDEAVSALAMAQIPGARWLQDGESRSELEAAGYVVYEDPSSYALGSDNVRQIVMPVRVNGTAQGVIDAYNFQRDRLVTEINSPPDNPYIRVPETS